MATTEARLLMGTHIRRPCFNRAKIENRLRSMLRQHNSDVTKYVYHLMQNSEEAVVVTTEIYRVEMAHFDRRGFSTDQSSRQGSSAETSPGSPSPEGDADLEEDGIADQQQVSRSHDDLYDSLDGTLVYEDNQEEGVEGFTEEQQRQLSTTYTLEAEQRELTGQEQWEVCQPVSQENSLPESQERTHPESWSMSQPDSCDTSHPGSPGMSQSDSGDTSQSESQIASLPCSRSARQQFSRERRVLGSGGLSQPCSRSRSQLDSRGISQPLSRGRSQLHSRDMSQPCSRGRSQTGLGGMSQQCSRGRSQLDSTDRSQLNSGGLSQLESSGMSQSQSCCGDSGESCSYTEPIITVVESDIDTVMGEGDILQVDSRKSRKIRVPHDRQYAHEDNIPTPQVQGDVLYEGDVYYDGCQYTVFGDNVECDGTSTGTGENAGTSLADDNESELERLSYDEEEDGANENPMNDQVDDDENHEQIYSRGYYQTEQEECIERHDLEGAAEEEDGEGVDANETKILQSSHDGTLGEVSEADNNSYHSDRTSDGVDKYQGKFGKRNRHQHQADEYMHDDRLKTTTSIVLDGQSTTETEKSEVEFTNHDPVNYGMSHVFIGDNIMEPCPNYNATECGDLALEENAHHSLKNSQSDNVCLNQELNNHNPHFLSRVDLEEDSFTVKASYRSHTALSSKSSTRSGYVKSADNDKPQKYSSEGKTNQKSSRATSQHSESSREQQSSAASAAVPDTCVENDTIRKKTTCVAAERQAEPYTRPETRLCFRMDIPASPDDESTVSSTEHEANLVETTQLKSKLDSIKPIPVEKSSQLFVMHGLQVCDTSTLKPHPPIWTRSQSRDASYEDTSDSGRHEKRSVPSDQTKFFNGQRKHRLSSTKRNKRRSDEMKHNLSGCGPSESQISSENKNAPMGHKHRSQIESETNSDSDIEKSRLSPVEQVRKFCPTSRRKHCQDVTAMLENVVYHGVPLAPELSKNDTSVKVGNPKAKKNNETEQPESVIPKQRNKSNNFHRNQDLLSKKPKNQDKHSERITPKPSREDVRKQLFQSDDKDIASEDRHSRHAEPFTNNGGGETGTSEVSHQQRSPSTSSASLGAHNKKINFIDQNRRKLSRGGSQKSYREIFLAKKSNEKGSPSTQSQKDNKTAFSDKSEVEGTLGEDDFSRQHTRQVSSRHRHLHAWSDQSSFSSHGEENADSRFHDSPPHSPSPSTEESASGGDNFAPRLMSRPQIPRPTVNARHVKTGYANKIHSLILDTTKHNVLPTTCRQSDSEELRTDGFASSPKESTAARPTLSQQNLKEHVEKSSDKPKVRRPSRLPVLRAPRPPPRPPPPPPELSPVPPGPALSQTASDQEDVCSHHSQADSVDSGGDKSKYKAYTMKDYRSLRTETKMGGLGPHRNQALIQEKLQKYQRQAQYAHQVADRNRKLLFARLEKPKCSYVQLAQEAEKQNKASCRQKGIDYARSVSRPPGRGKDPQLEESCSKSDGSKKGKRPAAGRDSNKGVKLPPLTNNAVTNKGAKDHEPLDTSSDGPKFDDSLEITTTTEEQHPEACSSFAARKTTENIIESLMDTSAVDKLRQRHEQEKAMVKQLCEKGEGSRTSMRHTPVPQ